MRLSASSAAAADVDTAGRTAAGGLDGGVVGGDEQVVAVPVGGPQRPQHRAPRGAAAPPRSTLNV